MKSNAQAQVIGSLILIVITVILWSTVWLWMNSTVSTYSEYTTRESENVEELAKEKIVIEKVVFEEPNSLSIFITNVGDFEVKVCSIYIGTSEAALDLVWEGEVKLTVDQGIWVNASYSWSSDTLYLVRVCTMRGGVFDEFFRAP
ncbi:MAG: hypothetical protein DRJ49_06680 [Thermoprotei archaeon]|nr:MAG: hypothetical protein DRJ49_06680 [Thermoprotei archaeon]